MSGYKLLSYVLWRAVKWYLRRRLPTRRLAAGAGLALVAAAAAAFALLRRATA